MTIDTPKCELCGEPMPAGEEMFKFHGYSGNCPKPPLPPQPDDLAVDRFAAAMKAKLALKRSEGRGGWDGPDCSAQILSDLLRAHVEKGDPLDVGNLAMMIHQRGERII